MILCFSFFFPSLSPPLPFSLSLLLSEKKIDTHRFERMEERRISQRRMHAASMFRRASSHRSVPRHDRITGAVPDQRKRIGKGKGEGGRARAEERDGNDSPSIVGEAEEGRQRGEFFIVARFLATVRWRPPLPDQNHTRSTYAFPESISQSVGSAIAGWLQMQIRALPSRSSLRLRSRRYPSNLLASRSLRHG